MPDLGEHAGPVIGAYLAGLLAIAALVGVAWLRARNSRRALERAEREGRHG